MTTFTASEVRDQAEWLSSVSVIGTCKTCHMLRAFADRLEAEEKAAPVAWRSVSLPTTFICDAPKNLDYEKWEPLYTHPASADAERLAEALKLQIVKWRGSHRLDCNEGERAVMNSCALEIESILQALATCDAHSAQAQPPAASVTDAMKELADKYHELLWAVARKFPGETRHETALRYIREAECQEAALAAQENPNG